MVCAGRTSEIVSQITPRAPGPGVASSSLTPPPRAPGLPLTQKPGQAYLLTPRFPFTRALSLTAPGSRVGAPRPAGEVTCRAVPGHPAQGPQLQGSCRSAARCS